MDFLVFSRNLSHIHESFTVRTFVLHKKTFLLYNPLAISPRALAGHRQKGSAMELTLEERLNKLLDVYSHLYDIDRDVEIAGFPYPAAATYYLRDENYLLSKQHVLSAVEQHEYVTFLTVDHLDAPTLKKHIDLTREDGLSRVQPSKEHMFSYVTLVVLANTIDPEAKKLIKRTHYRKNYRMTLHGWMEYHVAAMEVSTNCFLSNPAGRGARKNLERNFALRKNEKRRE